MSEEPMLPMIPAIGDILGRKKRFIERKTTVIKCDKCQNKYQRSFTRGDFVFKRLDNEKCEKCNANKKLTIVEIYSEWIDPKKKN